MPRQGTCSSVLGPEPQEVFINNVRQEPDVAYFIREDSTGVPIIVEFSEALNSNDSTVDDSMTTNEQRTNNHMHDI